MAAKLAKELEEKEGRKEIKVKVVLDPFYDLHQRAKRQASQMTGPGGEHQLCVLLDCGHVLMLKYRVKVDVFNTDIKRRKN